MDPISRRGFVGTLGTAAGLGCLPYTPAFASIAVEPDRVVHTSGDGIGITPREYAALLNKLCQGKDVADDNYLLGGEVEAFEKHWAALLGKEAAVFMPSGTLANQLALRALAGAKRRVIVPEMSHIYNDTGDACQTLSGQTLMPLAPGLATFTRADVEAVLARTAGGRVATDVGFHVRRMFGGNLAVGWNAALVARHYMDGFEGRLKSAVQVSESFYSAMAKHPKLAIERIPNGTNLTRITFKGVSVAEVGQRLAERGVALSGPQGPGTITFGVNETWNRMTAAELVRAFDQAL